MKEISIVTLSFFIILHIIPIHAQWRENQPAVLDPPPLPTHVEKDYIGPFSEKYIVAGSPRIVLFWNVTYDDRLEESRQEIETTSKSGTSDSSSFEETTNGAVGVASLKEGDIKNSETTTYMKTTKVHNISKRKINLNERDAIELKIAFLQKMRSAGVRFINRAAIIRTTHADNPSNTVANPTIIETNAILGKSDLQLEILMVLDRRAPIGWGFKVSLRNIKKGQDLINFYTQAQPNIATLPGRYIAANNGFEWVQPEVTATITDVGESLAYKVMQNIGSELP